MLCYFIVLFLCLKCAVTSLSSSYSIKCGDGYAVKFNHVDNGGVKKTSIDVDDKNQDKYEVLLGNQIMANCSTKPEGDGVLVSMERKTLMENKVSLKERFNFHLNPKDGNTSNMELKNTTCEGTETFFLTNVLKSYFGAGKFDKFQQNGSDKYIIEEMTCKANIHCFSEKCDIEDTATWTSYFQEIELTVPPDSNSNKNKKKGGFNWLLWVLLPLLLLLAIPLITLFGWAFQRFYQKQRFFPPEKLCARYWLDKTLLDGCCCCTVLETETEKDSSSECDTESEGFDFIECKVVDESKNKDVNRQPEMGDCIPEPTIEKKNKDAIDKGVCSVDLNELCKSMKEDKSHVIDQCQQTEPSRAPKILQCIRRKIKRRSPPPSPPPECESLSDKFCRFMQCMFNSED